MKGNQEPMLYTTNATVAALNHVPGFDPLKFLRRTISRKTGEDVMRLDLRYKKLWFRLACPTGRLKLNALRITEKMAIFEAKVYRDREDAEPLSSYVANCTLDATPGGLYVEAAQEEALDTALSNAGFGIQFADVGSESEEYGSEVPVGAKVEIAKPVQVKTADSARAERRCVFSAGEKCNHGDAEKVSTLCGNQPVQQESAISMENRQQSGGNSYGCVPVHDGGKVHALHGGAIPNLL